LKLDSCNTQASIDLSIFTLLQGRLQSSANTDMDVCRHPCRTLSADKDADTDMEKYSEADTDADKDTLKMKIADKDADTDKDKK